MGKIRIGLKLLIWGNQKQGQALAKVERIEG